MPALLAFAVAVCLGCRSRSQEQPTPARLETRSPDAPAPIWWRSLDECRRSLELDPPIHRAGEARIGTWNVRWFPDGESGAERELPGTNVAWVACAIARLEVDLLAVQEFKRHPPATGALRELVTLLDRHTGGRWKIELESCGRPEDGHVGIAWDGARVQARELREEPALLAGERCDADWRPGLAGHFSFPGGFDAHVIVLHAVAGEGRARLEARTRIFAAIAAATEHAQRRVPDADLIVLGDYNTSGCREDCDPVLSPAQEVDRLAHRLRSATPELRVVPNTLGCTEYHDDAPYALDLIAVSAELGELPPGAKATVDGYCAESGCSRDYEPKERPYERLSDHCPVLLDISDRDLD